ncbi:UbiC family transcriptional regulator [Spongiactinospora rosea]|uniref:UbiC family transcriptional regulator n=1 Tax=Spongiactinospora rosea TaxID=2248750 RepID=A0A366LSC9_9ACTN|nr:UTRA domain-containing protein [Spongiactinospora rosea]RBQ16520.1 UbiC family transcriptional regulator [Spongiactinospora rosea]
MADERTWINASAPYMDPRPGRADAWTDEAAQRGHVGMQQLREVAEVEAPPEVAEAFDTPSGDAVVVRRRVVLLDGRPVELVDSYYPSTVARGTRIADPRKVPGGVVTLLAEMGYRPESIEEDVHARPASTQERQLLHLGERDWVLVLARLLRTRGGMPYEMSVMTMSAYERHLRYKIYS